MKRQRRFAVASQSSLALSLAHEGGEAPVDQSLTAIHLIAPLAFSIAPF
jgi:hypothetical protein